MGTKIEPLGNRVLLRRVEAKAVSDGGIAIPEAARDKLSRGIILGAGCDASDRLLMGHEVAFNEFAAVTLVVDREEYLVIEDKDLLAVLSQPDGDQSDG